MITIELDLVADLLNEDYQTNLVSGLVSNFDPVVIAECPDCGKFIVIVPDYVSIIETREDYIGATICIYCERPVIDEIPPSLVPELMEKGVKYLEW